MLNCCIYLCYFNALKKHNKDRRGRDDVSSSSVDELSDHDNNENKSQSGEDSSEFSGFSTVSDSHGKKAKSRRDSNTSQNKSGSVSPPRAPLRSVVHVVNETNRSDPHRPRDHNANGSAHEISGSNSGLVDLNNLAGISQENLNKLRSILGIDKSRSSQTVADTFELSQEGYDWESDSSVLVHRDRASNNSQSLNKGHSHNARQGSRSDDIEKSLYDDDTSSEEDDNWPQPLLKASEKGDPISRSLAKLINDSCTQQCEVKQTIEKYKVPSNCEFMSAPRVNEEIWGDLVRNKKVQTTDKVIRDS